MGTSLSGLTPATTFDGLLKVGDNDPLTANLKAISTGEGTDTILSLSNSALSIGGNTSVSGSVNTSASNALTIQNSDGTQLFAVRNDGRLLLGTSSNIMYLDDALLQTWQINNSYFSGQRVGIGVNASGSYRLHIKGSGATSATTSLLVQNSAGTQLLRVRDDNEIAIGSSITVQSTDISAYNSLALKTYTDNGWEQNFIVTGNGASSKVGIGETTPTARLQVKGSGATSATTALLVQNSAGTDLLEVRDDGVLKLPANKSIRFSGSESLEGNTTDGGYIRIAQHSQWNSTRINAPTNITEGNDAPDASAMLQADSTTKGFLPPRMTTTERDAISTPAEGLMVYNTTNHQMNYWNGSAWIAF